ncbi:hypothetical protein V6N13_061779 [Hibiscus sabdariffa]|uniref:S-protein homolog n=2 Tax=Hibiscus sabdariffa TaxID=183260 RepID=A0ABR1ZM42_9ROSI
MSLSAVSGRLIPRKTHVLVYNDLASGTDLIVHCKSDDDDLGVRHVAYGKNFEFHFRPNIWRNTLFHCTMKFNMAAYWFDIYVQDRDEDICDQCVWKVRLEGPCLIAHREICYAWGPPQA